MRIADKLQKAIGSAPDAAGMRVREQGRSIWRLGTKDGEEQQDKDAGNVNCIEVIKYTD